MEGLLLVGVVVPDGRLAECAVIGQCPSGDARAQSKHQMEVDSKMGMIYDAYSKSKFLIIIRKCALTTQRTLEGPGLSCTLAHRACEKCRADHQEIQDAD